MNSDMSGDAQEIVQRLKLLPHPEGGYYREIYRSKGFYTANSSFPFESERNYCTSIYYLLCGKDFSSFHRIKSDELWHYYKGTTPVEICILESDGNVTRKILTNNLSVGVPFEFVPAGCWFAARLTLDDSYALTGCTVSPGFDFKDFELANREELIKLYPKHKDIIEILTR